MSTNDLRDYYLDVWTGLVKDHKMSSEKADRLCDKYQQIIINGYEEGEGPVKISDQLAKQDKREAHEPGTKWSAGIRVAFNGENDPNDKWVKDYKGQSIWNFFDDLSDVLPPREAMKRVPERYKDAFKDYCIYYGMKWPEDNSNQGKPPILKIKMIEAARPEEPWERKSEAVLNRITMHDARKKCAALQKTGKLSNCLHEVTAAISLVQNALANGSPEVKDNALNSVEKKIVARAVLAEIISNFNFQPEDLR